ncbi:hypothetical protein Syun_005927 [Stephania yunnanensis]|uniref:R13L1/DRL21-like LRR repeat region domain-containing protein n=1 Tax=Stephania yunnanensis TaxID=152371 RepID=A0AAP0KVZ9_9MAGN
MRKASLAKRVNVLSKKSMLRKLKLHWYRHFSIGDDGGDFRAKSKIRDRHSSIGDEGGDFRVKLELYWDRDYSIGDECYDLQVLEELQPHPNLHELSIEGFRGARFPRWMSNGSLLPNLKSMMISNCSNCDHNLSFGELACLERLGIMNMSNVKSIGGSKDKQMDTTTTPQSSSYSCLKVLELGRMPNLEEWFEGNEVCYEELSITSCPNLRMTPHSFPSLKSLKLEDVGGTGVVSITSSLTSLTSLSITRCEDLEFLPEGLLRNNDQLIIFNVEKCPKLQAFKEEGLMVSNSSSLRELQIGMCDALKSIPDLRGLTSLQKLEIRSCGELEMIPKGFWSSFIALESLNVFGCKRLKGTIELSPSSKHLREVRIVYCANLERFDICSSSSTQQQLVLFSCCHTLEIYNCNAISSIDLRSFASLRELNITECSGLHALQGLPFLTALEELELGPFSEDLDFFPLLLGGNYDDDNGDEVASNTPLLPSLRKLESRGWPALQALPHHLQHLTMLKSLIIQDFTSLTELPEWMGNLTSLEELQIIWCANLTHLPSKEQMQRLTFLKRLWIFNCSRLMARCRRDGPDLNI